jgi:hypothetical protein
MPDKSRLDHLRRAAALAAATAAAAALTTVAAAASVDTGSSALSAPLARVATDSGSVSPEGSFSS